MALLGTAALAMWWDISADMRGEFEDWHSHEHFVERLGIPGFLRASRWKSGEGGTGIFVMYELADHAVLSSPAYLQHLNAPSPWSTKMMPHHHGMIRSQCHVLHSRGGAVGGHAVTIRLSPAAGGAESLRRALEGVITRIVARQGVVGVHLLRHERPVIPQTTEQRIRGADREADWVLVAIGHDADALSAAVDGELNSAVLEAAGAVPGVESARYALAHSATPRDVV